jgi:hypothetical protein
VADDERVRALLMMVADPPGGPVETPVTDLLTRARAGRRRRRVFVVAAVVVATATAVIVPTELIGGGGRGASPASPPAPTTPPVSAAELATDHWSTLPPAPIVGRTEQATVWTGSQMLIWGGFAGDNNTRFLADGAAFSPATNQWSVLPVSPLSARAEVASTWTGTDLFVWGGYDSRPGNEFDATADGALYDPATRQWHMLPPSPLSARASATALWTGKEVVVLGGEPTGWTQSQDWDTDAAAYNPSTNTWRRLSSLPRLPDRTVQSVTAVAAGADIYAWQTWTQVVPPGGGPNSFARAGVQMDRYDATTNQWATVPAKVNAPSGVSEPIWTGSEIVMPAFTTACPSDCPEGTRVRGARFDPGPRTWTLIPYGPGDTAPAPAVWTGDALLTYDSDLYTSGPAGTTHPGAAAAWSADTNKWTELPGAAYEGDDISSVWTGTQLLEWGQMTPVRDANTIHQPIRTMGLSFGP